MELDGTQSAAPPLAPVQATYGGPASSQPMASQPLGGATPLTDTMLGANPAIDTSGDISGDVNATLQGVNPALATTIAKAISLGLAQAPTTAAGWAQLMDKFSNPGNADAVQVAEQQGGTSGGTSTTTTAPTGPQVTGSPGSAAGWASAVLQDAGLPSTQNNIDNMLRWMSAEEPASNWSDRNNPLNASLGTSAADGTGSYASLAQGAQFTAQMIKQQNMSGIYNALASNSDINAFSAAVVASPWASSHYGGDPNHLATIPVPAGDTNMIPTQPGVQQVTTNNGAPSSSIVSIAQSQLGVPYSWGGESAGKAFDCSGLVQWVYAQAGDTLPRVAQDQYNATPKVAAGTALQPGDLLFFGSGPNGIEHVGIYIGNGQMIDAPHTGADVRVDQVFGPNGQSLWGNYVGATRPGDPTGQSTAPAGSQVAQAAQGSQQQYGNILQNVLQQMSLLTRQQNAKKQQAQQAATAQAEQQRQARAEGQKQETQST